MYCGYGINVSAQFIEHCALWAVENPQKVQQQSQYTCFSETPQFISLFNLIILSQLMLMACMFCLPF